MTTLLLALVLAAPPEPADNPLTVEKAALGRKLFFDSRLSADGTISCSSCHEPTKGWADGRAVAVGIGGRRGTRNSPGLVNVSNQVLMFRDGRASMLEGQALLPLTNRNELGNDSLAQVVSRLNATGYREEFLLAFGEPVTAENIAKAIASFERTITTTDAPIDRYLGGQTWALTRKQKRGYGVFQRSGCQSCHQPPDFRDHQFHNTGTSVNERDQGRETITQDEKDRDAFKTPSLREVGKTAPYFHSGRLSTLQGVVAHYDRGGDANANLDGRIRPLGLTADEKDSLVDFLSHAFESDGVPITKPVLPR